MVTYKPEYAQAFADLNYEWIKAYFAIEEVDRKALDHPEVYAADGEIFFVLVDDEPVGTVAMVPYSDDDNGLVLELAKWAVRPDQQGNGLSHLLMQACVDYAKERGATEVMLQTNDILAPALGLYQRFGFNAVESVGDDRYSRSDLEMRLFLNKEPDKMLGNE